MYTVNDIAFFFLSKDSMSPKKLQKLVYYAYCWILVLLNKNENMGYRLFDERIEAWVHGPVIPSLYHEFREYGWNNIPQVIRPSKEAWSLEQSYSEDVRSILEKVWSKYGKYSADQLELMTHKELPWQNARKGYGPFTACSNTISDRDIYEYFRGSYKSIN